MKESKYEAIWVRPRTKKRLKVQAAKQGMTFDEIINELIAAV